MAILGLVDHFFDVITSQLVIGTIFLLSCMSGSRKIVRWGCGLGAKSIEWELDDAEDRTYLRFLAIWSG